MVDVHHCTAGRIAVRWGADVRKRGRKKTGKRDPNSVWAKCRATICLQFKRQLILGRIAAKYPNHPLVIAAASEGMLPRYRDGTLWVDEHCEQCVLGGAGHHGQAGHTEYRFHQDAEGKYLPEEQGGKLPDRVPTTVPKKPSTASGAFGVAAPTRLSDGKRYAGKMDPISYTGKTVVGVRAYNQHVEAELTEKRNAMTGPKGGKSPWADYTGPNPYEQRYGAGWKDHWPKAFKYLCIIDIMAKVIDEGNRIFKGSTREHDWVIYHDRLSQWWEEDAQEYLRSRGFFHRQYRAVGFTNDTLTPYYKNKLMGDSPELMPLDSSLFNDLIEAIAKHVTATYHIPLPTKEVPQPNKYSMATPELAWATMTELWNSDGIISESRIFQDCDKFEAALDAIIAVQGTIVESMNNRNGHRAVAAKLNRESFEEKLTPQAMAGMKDQMKMWEGISRSTGMVFNRVFEDA